MDTDYSDYCPDCKKHTDIAIHHHEGDKICTECGLVLEAYGVDETAEWRNFNDDNNDKDPNRVGSAINPLLGHGSQLVTIISKQPKSKTSTDHSEDVLHSKKLHNPDAFLVRGFKVVASMAESLGLVALIRDQALDIYKRVDDQRLCRGRRLEAVAAACLYIACRESKLSRTLKEFCTVANGVKGKDINRAVVIIKRNLEVQMGSVAAGELVRRFCSNLGMKNQAIVAVQEAVAKAEEELDIRRSPKSLLAAIIYMVTQLSDEKVSIKDISVGADVAEMTIKKSYKDLYPYAARLLPTWYAKENDIKKLCVA